MLKETIDCKTKQNKIVGLAVSVVSPDEVLFTGGYGIKNMDKNTNVTENTVFGIASLSKAFASTLLVKLIEEKTQ